VRILSDRWCLERHAPGRAVVEVEADAPLAGLVRYAIGWEGRIEPWFTGYITNSIAVDPHRQRLRIQEIDRALALPLRRAWRNIALGTVLADAAAALGVTWSLHPEALPLDRRFAHVISLGTARSLVQRLGVLLAVPDWTIQATPEGRIYLGPPAGLHPRRIACPANALAEVTVEGATVKALPRLRPGSVIIPGGGAPMRIIGVDLEHDTYRLHWERLP
jgi:hypothetical protein